jgi:acyl carrier protein phosphodiesterase
LNFLAHLTLSPPGEDDIMVGNFFANFAPGKSWQSLPEGIGKGVLLHRRIDDWTDNHPIIKQSKALLPPEAGLFKGVLLDVYWDHFLARSFATYHTQTLASFTKASTTRLKEGASKHFPQGVPMVEAMDRHDWLCGYATLEGIDATLVQMGQRFPHENPLHHGAQWLNQAHDDLGLQFDKLWPQAMETFLT